MVKTDKLSKHFGSLKAVDDLDLNISQGEFFAFLGPNGAGKTTTLKMLAGLLRPTSGTAIVAGHDIQKEPEAVKLQLSYVPDFPFLYEKLTPREFMRFVGELFSLDPEKIARSTNELFEKLGLFQYEHELIDNLSHGTRQRLVIASALLHEPRIIIIDEPMVGLDPTHARIVKDELKEQSRRGTTVVLSTHGLSVAEEMADRIGIINKGRMIACGTVEELREQSRESGVLERVFLALINTEDGTDSPSAEEIGPSGAI